MSNETLIRAVDHEVLMDHIAPSEALIRFGWCLVPDPWNRVWLKDAAKVSKQVQLNTGDEDLARRYADLQCWRECVQFMLYGFSRSLPSTTQV